MLRVISLGNSLTKAQQKIVNNKINNMDGASYIPLSIVNNNLVIGADIGADTGINIKKVYKEDGECFLRQDWDCVHSV
ncbi:hypothetical protein SRRS_06310 [Sporomusa rhizae]|uniref:hypothetical protein n=1 Tax=Sporomusa rhizae TaxID=357999 RepID=UPI00352A924C